MENKLFDKLLDQLIKEAIPLYLEEDNKNYQEVEEVKFSEKHNKKMKKIFNEYKRKENMKVFAKVAKKVAIVVIAITAITCCLIPSVDAWKKEFTKFIMQNNNNNYMSINFTNSENYASGDISSNSGEANTYEIDGIKFLYLPKGFKIEKKETEPNIIYISFIKRWSIYKINKRKI